MPRCRALLVANSASGLGRTGRLASAIGAGLSARGVEAELALSGTPVSAGEAAAAAVARGCDRVVVAGGDGTINSVVGALAYTPTALGVVPTGMANAFARELGIPLTYDAACDIAAAGATRTVDLARAGDRHFALMAGVGFDADVVAHVSLRLKRLIGPGAYVLAGLAGLPRFRPRKLRLSWDEGEMVTRALMVVAANTAQYTYHWRIAPAARPDDGLLDVVVFGCRRALDPAAHAVGALTRRHMRHPGVVTWRTRRLRVECESPLPLQIDGDVAGVTPIEMEILPGALKVLAPRARAHTSP
ncbi:MAG: diacylglycerol kinase family lipid kinase [Armatimonadota bacterium]|nr:MAG: diacylglycerol kinase family lipid kinase [Armatimonadota bacterium]